MIETGKRVIVRSNENEPFKVGEHVGFSELGLHIVRIDGQDLICLGVVIPYTSEMEQFLKSMSNRRQWEVLSDLCVFRNSLTQMEDAARNRRRFP